MRLLMCLSPHLRRKRNRHDYRGYARVSGTDQGAAAHGLARGRMFSGRRRFSRERRALRRDSKPPSKEFILALAQQRLGRLQQRVKGRRREAPPWCSIDGAIASRAGWVSFPRLLAKVPATIGGLEIATSGIKGWSIGSPTVSVPSWAPRFWPITHGPIVSTRWRGRRRHDIDLSRRERTAHDRADTETKQTGSYDIAIARRCRCGCDGHADYTGDGQSCKS